ncbi:iron ABC transporter permease [Fodinibacter luteus]|uniref:Iron ABC transporter permease n=1 Tax=Fodinibacter luteus TaxID=552064 RepID=A0ABP8KBR8_9MICO
MRDAEPATRTPARRRGPAPPLFLTAPSVVVSLIALLPIGYLLIRTAEAGLARVVDILVRERTVELIARSLLLVVLVTSLSVAIGVGLAFLATRTDVPGRRTIAALAALPLAIPSYVAAFAWISAVPQLAGLPGAVLVLTLCCYPYVYLPVLAALRRADPGVEEVARSLGRSPWQTFREVTLRQVRPAAAAGGLLVALYTLSDFGAVSILRYDVFTRVIYTAYRSSFERSTAAVLSLLLVALTVAISIGESRVRRRDVARVGAGTARAAVPVRLGRGRLPLAGASAVVIGLALAFPVASLAYWFATGLSAGLDVAHLGESIVATAWLSLLGAIACTLGAVPVGILAARHRGRFTTVVEQVTYAGHALPGIVVALALVFLGVRVVPWAYQEAPLLVLAYVVLFLPTAVGSVRSSVAQSSVRGEEVARSLGSRPGEVLRRVTLPLAAPGIGAGAALVLLTCMKELPATLLLRPTGTDTLATSLWTETGVGAYGAAAPYGLALVVLAVLPTIWLMRLSDPDRGTSR